MSDCDIARRLLAHPLVAGAGHGGPAIPGNCSTARLMREAAEALLRPAAAPTTEPTETRS